MEANPFCRKTACRVSSPNAPRRRVAPNRLILRFPRELAGVLVQRHDRLFSPKPTARTHCSPSTNGGTSEDRLSPREFLQRVDGVCGLETERNAALAHEFLRLNWPVTPSVNGPSFTAGRRGQRRKCWRTARVRGQRSHGSQPPLADHAESAPSPYLRLWLNGANKPRRCDDWRLCPSPTLTRHSTLGSPVHGFTISVVVPRSSGEPLRPVRGEANGTRNKGMRAWFAWRFSVYVSL